jgi:hypothetical protein
VSRSRKSAPKANSIFREPTTIILGAYLGVAFGLSFDQALEAGAVVHRAIPATLGFAVFIWITYIHYLLDGTNSAPQLNGNGLRLIFALFAVAAMTCSFAMLFVPEQIRAIFEMSDSFYKIVLSFCPLFAFSSLYSLVLLVSR